MPASKEISINFSNKKLGIIAGGGEIPLQLKRFCDEQNIDHQIVGFKKFTDTVTPDYWGRLGASGKTVRWLKEQGVTDLIMIGSLKRPGIFDLWPDITTLKILIKSWLQSFGDSQLLSSVRVELERFGFQVHGVHKFLPELLLTNEVQGKINPTTEQEKDIELGVLESQKLGIADIGQAVIVKNGIVIAREDKRGTRAMIDRYGFEGSILVKTCKPQQDMDLDLPTIGVQTVKQCANKNMAGIVGHAGKTLFVDRDEAVELADQSNIFIYGASIDE